MEQKFCPFNTVSVISCFQNEVMYLFQGGAASFLCQLCSQIRCQGSFRDSWGDLKSCGRWVQVNCCCPQNWRSSHWKAKMGCFTGANWIKKKESFKSKHEKQVVSAGIRAKKVYSWMDWIIRSLWKLVISTAVPNNQQAEFGTASAAEVSKVQNAEQLLFLSCLSSEK
jgi:hypothetical protein